MLMLPQRAWRKIDRRIKMTWTAAKADTFLASYPKSGRTWLRFILSHYFARLADGDGAVDLHEMFQVVPNYDLDPIRGIPAFRYAEREDVPLILVSHHCYRRSLFLRSPVIFMVRDPRDVMVSAYFHATRHKHRFSGDIDAFIADEEQGLPAFVGYLNGWTKGLRHRRSFVLSYEELSKDTAGVSARILEFLGHSPVDAILADAVASSRFEAMREREIETGLPAHDYDRSDVQSLRMRSGVVGGFSGHLGEAQVRDIVRICREQLTPDAKSVLARTGLCLD